MRVELSQKAVYFLILAVEAAQAQLRARMADPDTSEDDYADCSNDHALYDCIKADLERALREEGTGSG